MKKQYVAIAALSILAIALIAFGFTYKPSLPESEKLSVVTSFYPLYFFASEIVGDKAVVQNITPAGAEPHEYEPTPQELVAIEESDVFILNGEGFEGWGEDVGSALLPEKTVVVTAAEGLATLEGEAHEEAHEDGEEEPHEEKEEHIVDPHVWLSPILAGRMVDAIAAGLIHADPENESFFRLRADALKAKLSTLDTSYRTGLASCARREIVTSHAAFGYIAQAYGLEQLAISGLSTEEEPSPQALAKAAEFAREHGVTHIFFETLVPSDLSETIATEVGAQTLELNPLEGLTEDEIRSGKDYLTVMRMNLENLRIALECN